MSQGTRMLHEYIANWSAIETFALAAVLLMPAGHRVPEAGRAIAEGMARFWDRWR